MLVYQRVSSQTAPELHPTAKMVSWELQNRQDVFSQVPGSQPRNKYIRNGSPRKHTWLRTCQLQPLRQPAVAIFSVVFFKHNMLEHPGTVSENSIFFIWFNMFTPCLHHVVFMLYSCCIHLVNKQCPALGEDQGLNPNDLLSHIKYSLGLKSPAIDFSIYLSISIYINYIYIYTHT